MILEAINQAIMITGFVFVMMLIIEYINIQTQGVWHESLVNSKWKQYIVAGTLGILPGCLGSFTSVAMFSHGILKFGAVVTAMIATSGDSAFVMFAMIPGQALLITGILFVIGIIAGILTDKIFNFGTGDRKLELHEEEKCNCFPKNQIIDQLKNISLPRASLISLVILILAGLLTGKIGPESWNWVRGTVLFATSASLFIVTTVPDHFLKDHFWDHIVKKHIPQIFLWSLGALIILKLLTAHLPIQEWIQANKLIVLFIAVLVGLIPESGPHIVFITLFAEGALPFSILLANSIVQDGHGMLPMLAESRINFIKIKSINLVVGLFVGGLALFLNTLI